MAILLKRIPGGRIGNFLAGAVVASVIGGTAVAITSPNFTYTQVQRGYFTINPMAMVPQNSANTYLTDFPTELSGTGCFGTGVNLPAGATIVSVTTWYKSNAQSNLNLKFYRHNMATNGFNPLAVSQIVNDDDTRRLITSVVPANLRVVNNLHFSYGYGFCIETGTIFYGARINYTYRTAGD